VRNDLPTAAERWVEAVNAEGQHRVWRYGMARKVEHVLDILDRHRG
jgi:hypothetical protein